MIYYLRKNSLAPTIKLSHTPDVIQRRMNHFKISSHMQALFLYLHKNIMDKLFRGRLLYIVDVFELDTLYFSFNST